MSDTTPSSKQISCRQETLLRLGLFLLALIPRAVALQQFVTADESKWVYRSAQFLRAFLQGDFAGTAVNLTPAVTTTWLGSVGLSAYYLFHRVDLGLPFTNWLATLPQFRADLSVLAATRWAMAVFSSLSIVLIYVLAKRLWGRRIALIGAILIALSPHTLALTRIIGHDAPAAIFVTFSILSLFIAERRGAGEQGSRGAGEQGSRGVGVRGRGLRTLVLSEAERTHYALRTAFWLLLSGASAGLAFLSKSPTLFLIPFTILYVIVNQVAQDMRSSRVRPTGRLRSEQGGKGWTNSLSVFKSVFLWGAAAYAFFFIFWPAVWVAPVYRPYSVIESAFFSATSLDEPAPVEEEEEANEQVPSLGPFYYLVNGAFKLSPLVTLGLLIGIVGAGVQVCRCAGGQVCRGARATGPSGATRNTRHATRNTSRWSFFLSDPFWLTTFVLLFIAFMSLGDKQSSRYILPVFPALAFLAAFGWRNFAIRHLPFTIYHLPFTIVSFSLLTLLPYAPYYFTYFNPLLGGPLTAPRLVKIGWGEGMDQAGEWLEQQPDSAALTVGADYASTLAPYFAGRVVSPTSDNLDYVVAYIKQRQSGSPPPEALRYYEQVSGSSADVRLGGIDYASVYPGPAAQLVEGVDGLIAFRPSANFAPIGGAWTVDLIWQDPSTASPQLSLRGEETIVGQAVNLSSDAIARYTFTLPESTRPDDYILFADEQPIGAAAVRYTQLPAHFSPVEANFGDEIQLIGYNPEFILSDAPAVIELAFKETPKAWADYTVFVHLIDEDGNRVAGHDAQPSPPTSRWLKGEVVLDRHALSLPPNLPLDQNYRFRVGLYRADTGEALGESYVLPIDR